MPKKNDTRDRVLRTAATLFRTQGYHATGLNQVLAEGGAPKGSLYFHFPGGKEQLAVESLQLSGGELCEQLKLAASLDDVIDLLATALVESGFRDGCPITTVALDAAGESEQIREACDTAYLSWEGVIADHLERQGVAEPKALATTVLATIEGALILARTRKDVTPLRQAGDHLKLLIHKE
ncbi:TetR/AcrR family transcriptional regulator [Kibdelosporangium phytohabitans]|uniref:TetR family transcriptional regulator n=1 Tax=Kibdelosporangium phytohabitans TaxID=860235 RepID=A0A0N7F2K4_9PSEU|nr:TetR/AcrR family transcriptional regulator [Kibdelosporangium phytohabitans]ALG06079.1 TetR family transcriptional regulator [Kibdelosporangium phytohabitans]MBE1465836.1 TetR/AcrR family transcriptional repressor of lmrAB and yxaGH operons [Kibdelosporangium phytohabitans]